MKALRTLAVALAAASLVLLGAGVAGAKTGAAKPQKGGTLNIFASSENYRSLDPIALRGVPFYESPGSFAVYDALFYDDPTTLKIVPRIATGMTTSDSGLSWTLKLRSDVKFSDGTPFDAAAVQYNWQRIADPANKALTASTAQAVQSMTVVDPLTLKVTLATPDPNFNHRVSYALNNIASPTALKSMGTSFGDKGAIGAGPFILKEWLHDDHQTYVRNPTYWEKGKPYVDQINFKIIADDQSRYSTLKTTQGSIDYMYEPSLIPQVKSDGLPYQTMVPNGGGWSLLFNTSKPPFNDVRVRQAIDLALDRKQFNETRRASDPALMMDTIDRKGTPFYDPAIKVPKTDVPAAQKLIDQVVAENGGKPIEFTFTTYSTTYHPLDAQVFQQEIQKLKNVTMNIEMLAATVVISKFTTGNFQVFPTGLPKWNEPAVDMVNTFLSTSGTNYAKYSNPTVDANLKQLLTATDQKTRVQLVHEVEQQVLKDAPVAWVSRSPSYQIQDKFVKDAVLYFDQRMLLDQVWVATKKT